METAAFIDLSCRQCRNKFGFYGRIVDCPPCPRCGFRPDAAALEHDQAEMDNFREVLAELRTANHGWDKWRKARVAAGLTLRSAARILEIYPTTLSEIERGEKKPSEALLAKMIRCYDGS